MKAKKYTREQLEAAGGRYWEKGEMHRVYFNSLSERIGLSLSFYKTGNISSASLNGDGISNSEARRILWSLENGKFWYDLDREMFMRKGLDDFSDEIKNSVISDIEKTAANSSEHENSDDTPAVENTYEMTSGYVGSMGMMWNTVDEKTANEAIDRAAKYVNVDRSKLINRLNDGNGMAVETGKQSPNYYYDHGMEMIRSTYRTTPKIEIVKCSCGHSVPRHSVMSASLGTSCPDCYDRMSN
jgi:hypothetical protein